MYIFDRNTKIFCFTLMTIGVIALLSGFLSAEKNSYSDKEIKKIVKELYKENSIKKIDEVIDTHSGHHKKVESEDYHYASLFSKIEKRFNCHLNYDQKKNAHNIDDVIYVTQHYFHTIKQRPGIIHIIGWMLH